MIVDLSCLGFFGFAVATFAMATVHAGWYTKTSSGIFQGFVMMGGIAQIIGGFSDAFRGNGAGATILISFGLYWLGEGINQWPTIDGAAAGKYGDVQEYNQLQGYYKFCWALMTLPMIYTNFQSSLCQGVTLTVVCCVFFLHAWACFAEGDTKEDINKGAAYLMIVAAALAYYMGCGLYLTASGCRKSLPFGRRYRLFQNNKLGNVVQSLNHEAHEL